MQSLLTRVDAFTAGWYDAHDAGAAYPWYVQEAYEAAQACLERPHRDNFEALVQHAEELLGDAEATYVSEDEERTD